MRRKIGGKQAKEELPHFSLTQAFARFHCGPAGVGGGKSLQTIAPSAESASSQIGHHLTEINVTSPTGVRELDKQFKQDIGGQFIDAVVRRKLR